jgi:4'-phosphopantetheinyl transferase
VGLVRAGKARVTLEHIPLAGNLDARVRLLESPDPRVLLTWCALTDDAGVAKALEGWLSPPERARAARFGAPALRRRYVLGRATLRAVLARRLDLEPGSVAIARGRRGRPYLAGRIDLDFNVSHTVDALLIAVAEGVTVGVDVERADRTINAAGVARRCLTAGERESLADLDAEAVRRRVLRLWTCKEAMSKATGDALAAPFRALDIELAPALRLRDGPAPYVPGDWHLYAPAVPDTHLATLALWSHDRAAEG